MAKRKSRRSEPETALLSGHIMAVDWAKGTAELHTPEAVLNLRFEEQMGDAMQALARLRVAVGGQEVDGGDAFLVDRFAWLPEEDGDEEMPTSVLAWLYDSDPEQLQEILESYTDPHAEGFLNVMELLDGPVGEDEEDDEDFGAFLGSLDRAIAGMGDLLASDGTPEGDERALGAVRQMVGAMLDELRAAGKVPLDDEGEELSVDDVLQVVMAGDEPTEVDAAVALLVTGLFGDDYMQNPRAAFLLPSLYAWVEEYGPEEALALFDGDERASGNAAVDLLFSKMPRL
jgi:hypothetical protein